MPRTTSTTTCPNCGQDGCKVREQHVQATRTTPMRFIGLGGYCPACDLGFKVPQELTEFEMDEILAAIAAAVSPLDALVAALRLTFVKLGAGDIAEDDCPTIDGREWPLDREQWSTICSALHAAGQKHATALEAVNLGLDWMNKGPGTRDVRAAVGVAS